MNHFMVPSIPITNIRHRKQFRDARKMYDESIGDWYSRLYLLACECDFGQMYDLAILEQFIFGLEAEFIDRLCLEIGSITLDQSIQLTKHFEETRYQQQVHHSNEVKAESYPQIIIKEETHFNDIEAICNEYENNHGSSSTANGSNIGQNDCKPPTSINVDEQSSKNSQFVASDAVDELDGNEENSDSDTDAETVCKAKKNVAKSTSTALYTAPKRKTSRRRKRDPNEPKKIHYKIQQMLDTAPPEMEISADFKTFSCKLCGHSLKCRTNLVMHIKKHKNIRDFICEYCGKEFCHRDSYRDHVKAHTGVRDYVCDQCPKAFRTLDVLKVHKLSHTDQKPHVCSECGKAFRQRTGLYYHKRTHTGEKPHVCKFCGKAFSQTSSLRTHEKSQHQI